MAGDSNKTVSFTVMVKDAASAVLKQLGDEVNHVTSKLFSFKDVVKGLGEAFLAFKLVEVIKDMAELGIAADKTFRQIAAALPTFTQGMTELQESLDKTAQKAGRSLEDVRGVALEIAKLGVSSADDLALQTSAAIRLSDATGVSATTTAQILQQLRREYDLTGEQAEETAAKLATAARGKADIEELFGALQRSTPIFQKFGIDADTGTRAIIALVNAGHGARAIGKDLSGITASGIRELAETVKVGTDALDDYEKHVAHVEDSTAATLERVKNEWKTALEDIWGNIKTFAAGAFDLLSKLPDANPNEGNKNFASGRIAAPNPYSGFTSDAVDPFAPGANFSVDGTSEKKTDAEIANAKRVAQIIKDNDIAAQKAAEEAAKKIRELRLEFDALAVTSDVGKTKAEALSLAIARITEKARDGKMSAAELNEQLSRLRGTLAEIQGAEAADAMAKLDDAFTKFSGGAVEQLDKEFNDLLKNLADGRNAFEGNAEGLVAYNDRINELRDRYQALRDAVVDATAATKEIADIEKGLAANPFDQDAITSGMKKLIADLDVVKGKMAAATDPKVAEQYKKELKEIEDELDKLGLSLGALNPPVLEHVSMIKEVAEQWATIARTAIAAGQAIGKVGSATAALLQNTVSLGEGLAKIKGGQSGGDKAAGAAEAAASLGGLISTITDMGHAASRAQQQAAELAQTIGKLFTGLENEIHGSGSLSARLAAGSSEYADARNTIQRDLGGKSKQTERETALDRLNKLEAERLQQIRDEYALEQTHLQEDYHVRLLRAESFTTEADAEELAERQQREMTQAIADGANEATQATLATTQAAEAQAALAAATTKAAEASLSAATTRAQQEIDIYGITDPTQQFAKKAQAYKTAGGALGDLLSQFDLEHLSADDISRLDDQFKDLFKQLEDSPDTVNTAGLSIDDLISALEDLVKSANGAASGVTSAADAMAAASQKLTLDEQIFGTTPLQHAYGLASSTGLYMPGYDLSTSDGRAAAIAYLQAQYGLHPDMGKQIADEIAAIRAIPDASTALAGAGGPTASAGSSSAAAQAFQSLTTIQGDDLRNILFMSYNVQKDIRDGLFGKFNVGSFKPVTFGSGGNSTIGGTTIGPVYINVDGSGDPQTVAEEVARALDRNFGRKLNVQKKYNGDIGTNPS